MSCIEKQEINFIEKKQYDSFKPLFERIAENKIQDENIVLNTRSKIMSALGSCITAQDVFDSLHIDFDMLFYTYDYDEDDGPSIVSSSVYWSIFKFITEVENRFFDGVCLLDEKIFKDKVRALELHQQLIPFIDTLNLDWDDLKLKTIYTYNDSAGIKLENRKSDYIHIDIEQFINILTNDEFENCYDYDEICISWNRPIKQENIQKSIDFILNQINRYNEQIQKWYYNGHDKQFLRSEFETTMMNLCELFVNIDFKYLFNVKLTKKEMEEKTKRLNELEAERKKLLVQLGKK